MIDRPSSNPPRSRFGFWLLIGILAVTGVALATTVLLGQTESRGFGLAGVLFLADLYLVLSLVARHSWLRRTIWVGTVVTFIFGAVLVFWPDQDYYVNGNVPYEDLVRTQYGFLMDLNYALHTVVAALLALGILSLAYAWIAAERPIRVVYYAMYFTGLLAALLWAIGFIVPGSNGRSTIELGVTILALTAAAIVVIAAFVQRNSQNHARGDEELRALVRQYVDEYLAERER